MPLQLSAALLGAGEGGFFSYGPFAKHYPTELEFVAVAEPNKTRRHRFARTHNIPANRQFHSWEDLLAQTKLADLLFNMTPTSQRVAATMCALERGYDVLHEQPLAPTLPEATKLVHHAERLGRILQVSNPLRHTAFFTTLHDVVASGQLGDIITVEHRENISYWHMAHSFVRGKWANSTAAAPMLVSRCADDLNVLYWNMGGLPRYINAFGSLVHFQPKNAPAEATTRCTAGCQVDDCLYDARRVYLNLSNIGWPISTITDDLSIRGRQEAIETGPYGRCIYHCDNDVVDHQVVNMQFANGASAVLVMHGHAYQDEITMRYDGTKATLRGRFDAQGGNLEIHGHWANRWESVDIPLAPNGEGNGNFGQVRAFLQAVQNRNRGQPCFQLRHSLESHLIAFAAEKARNTKSVVNLAQFCQEQGL